MSGLGVHPGGPLLDAELPILVTVPGLGVRVPAVPRVSSHVSSRVYRHLSSCVSSHVYRHVMVHGHVGEVSTSRLVAVSLRFFRTFLRQDVHLLDSLQQGGLNDYFFI